MNVFVNRNDFTPVYYQIAERLSGEIKSGKLAPGEQLLPEDKLAERYGISRKTLRQALDKLAKEGYVARLKGKGTFVSDSHSERKVVSLVLEDSFFGNYHRTINDLIGGAAHEICSSGTELRLNTIGQIPEIIERKRAGKMDVSGFVFLRYRDSAGACLEEAKRAGIPLVIEGAALNGENFVDIDNAAPMREAAEYLAGLGHKKIGVVSFPGEESPHFSARARAAAKSVEDITGSTASEWTLGASIFDPGAIQRELKKILTGKNTPSAFICVSDNIAVGIIKMARELGLSVPGDFSVTGFDDIAGADLLTPPLTTFRQDYFQMGKTAARTLLDISSDFKNRKRQIVIKPEFIIRGSCAAPERRAQ
jgi:GntR family transcriptional regulator of arabinose operon